MDEEVLYILRVFNVSVADWMKLKIRKSTKYKIPNKVAHKPTGKRRRWLYRFLIRKGVINPLTNPTSNGQLTTWLNNEDLNYE